MQQAQIYLHGFEEVRSNEISKPIRGLRKRSGGTEQAAEILGYNVSEVSKVLRFKPLPDYEGPDIFHLTTDDLRLHSLPQLRRIVGGAIIHALEEFGSTDDIALFLGIKEWQVRRLRQAWQRFRH